MPPDLPAHEGHPSLLASLGMCTGELPPPFIGTESGASTRTPSILVLPQPSCLHSPAANSLPSTVVDTPESTAAAAPAATKRKATEEAKSQVKRVKWTNKMVGELLRLRFSDGDVKRRLESADTKTKTALAWQYFASVLSQELGMVLNRDQVSLKYRKLKCVYRKEKREQKWTGNAARIREMNEGLWAILNDAFGGRVGISGEVLLDSAIDEDDDEGMEVDVTQATEEVSKQKPAPVAQLATASQGGMKAIAFSLGARSSAEDQLRALTSTIQQQQEETRKFQEMQLQLLRELLAQRQ
ncbi:hypothetical protein GN958_ATG14466 [Phytophthora infestans]|uniref:Myb/SANT-like domain-containing protein n=1 Tax=Phytophthora infestans TaxID=4787 RepID=A0A8S9UBG1_PHYIN|nr:hypothetical protein GN958_ATG14466 [Phytophthora infestans]